MTLPLKTLVASILAYGIICFAAASAMSEDVDRPAPVFIIKDDALVIPCAVIRGQFDPKFFKRADWELGRVINGTAAYALTRMVEVSKEVAAACARP